MLRNKTKNYNFKLKTFKILSFVFWFCVFSFAFYVFIFAENEFKYDSKGRRNPFIPLVTSDGRLLKLEDANTQGNFLVEGIICDKQGISYAIINGEVVKVGDSVGDYQVLKVELKKVILIKEGVPLEVNFNKEEE